MPNAYTNVIAVVVAGGMSAAPAGSPSPAMRATSSGPGWRTGRGYSVMRNATSYLVTDARRPGVSAAGIAFSASSPRR
jgi:hypothetical protein